MLEVLLQIGRDIFTGKTGILNLTRTLCEIAFAILIPLPKNRHFPFRKYELKRCGCTSRYCKPTIS